MSRAVQQTLLDYDGFVEKFKPRKTTDDCYTPPEVYEAVLSWASGKGGFDRENVVRPFYPGGDYERFDYPEGCTVVDNPPFSILSRIIEFYLDGGIPFVLFAPSLTAFSSASVVMRCNHVFADSDITYENGAVVRTSFVTSFGAPVVAETAPELAGVIERVQMEKNPPAALPKYGYPDHVLTAAMLARYAKRGIRMEVRADECCRVSALDAQRPLGKAVFGGGLLLSDAKAAERAAAERAAAHVFELSERERAVVALMSAKEAPCTSRA